MSQNRFIISIITWNRLNSLIETLSTFKKYNDCLCDFVLVNNGSTDDTSKFIKKEIFKYGNFHIIENNYNKGIFNATKQAWEFANLQGYDYILNLQNDFPSSRYCPFNYLIKFMDDNKDVGFIKLNIKKKSSFFNLYTQYAIAYEINNVNLLWHENGWISNYELELIRQSIDRGKRRKICRNMAKCDTKYRGLDYKRMLKLNWTGANMDCGILKSNYHFGFNPHFIRSSIIDKLLNVSKENEREAGIMEQFNKTKLKSAMCFPAIFLTYGSNHSLPGWKH